MILETRHRDTPTIYSFDPFFNDYTGLLLGLNMLRFIFFHDSMTRKPQVWGDLWFLYFVDPFQFRFQIDVRVKSIRHILAFVPDNGLDDRFRAWYFLQHGHARMSCIVR